MSERKMRGFRWTPKANAAAVALAEGKQKREVAAAVGIGEATIYRWLSLTEFKDEVDRLSLMVDIAGRAERLRMAMRAVRQKTKPDGTLETEKDALDWLKFAQSETDGVKLDLVKLAEASGLYSESKVE